jgi:hypothetical protein
MAGKSRTADFRSSRRESRTGEVCALADRPGGDFASLCCQSRCSLAGREVHTWGLFTRNFWLDDAIGEMTTILDLISPHVAEDGYGGYFREEYDAEPTVFVFRDRGYGAAHPAGGQRD